jgi:hypothetical protein
MVWLLLLAAWGILCLIWVVLGWFFSNIPFTLIYRCSDGQHPDGAIARYFWLRSMGLISGPLFIVGTISPQEQKIWKQKHPNIEFLKPEDISSASELERTI